MNNFAAVTGKDINIIDYYTSEIKVISGSYTGHTSSIVSIIADDSNVFTSGLDMKFKKHTYYQYSE